MGAEPRQPFYAGGLPPYLQKFSKEKAIEILIERAVSPFYSRDQIEAFEKTGFKFDTVGWAMDTGYIAKLTTANSNIGVIFKELEKRGTKIASTSAILDNRVIRNLLV
ncbi:MAG: hypothetical protein QW390_04165, partial [Candidatus Bathyarchaeia archaeon]